MSSGHTLQPLELDIPRPLVNGSPCPKLSDTRKSKSLDDSFDSSFDSPCELKTPDDDRPRLSTFSSPTSTQSNTPPHPEIYPQINEYATVQPLATEHHYDLPTNLTASSDQVSVAPVARPSRTKKSVSLKVGDKVFVPDQEPDGDIQNHGQLHEKSYYFDDGRRVIDFVLAYQPKQNLNDPLTVTKEMQLQGYRTLFEQKMLELGLELEYEGLEGSQDGKTCFVKIHASWDFLCEQAELQQIKVPLAPLDAHVTPPKRNFTDESFEKMFNSQSPFNVPKAKTPHIGQHFKARFDRSREDIFLIHNRDTFFTTTQRIRMVWDSIQRIAINVDVHKWRKKLSFRGIANKIAAEAQVQDDESIENAEQKDVSLFWLFQQDAYMCGYPIHDSNYKYPRKENPFMKTKARFLPQRLWLYKFWATFLSFRYRQPLDQIWDYFGERIGMYFAWLGFYTRMLMIPSLAGIICFLYGICTLFVSSDSFVDAICDDHSWGNKTACRLCLQPHCPYKMLSNTCGYAKISHVFDNYSTVVFAIFISVWAVIFIDNWKRRQAELAVRWDAADVEFNDVVLRPQYQLSITTTRVNHVTLEREPYLEPKARYKRVATSLAVSFFFIFLIFSFLAAIIIYRILSVAAYAKTGNMFIQKVSPTLITSITASVINAIVIFIMNLAYKKVAWQLTEYEFPRTEHDFDVSYTYKVMMFQFMNYYGGLIYLALLKGKSVGTVAKMNAYSDQCGYSGCMAEVCIQLIIIMGGMQMLNNIFEVFVPMIKSFYKSLSITVKDSADNEFTRWERDFILNEESKPCMFADYLEMIIQYGFVVMFSCAFPLAAVFALFNNILEIRIDANKIITEYRRPIPERVQTIGAWLTILDLFTKLAVITNAVIIAFTSNFVDRAVYQVFYHVEDSNLTYGEQYMNHTFTTFYTSTYYQMSEVKNPQELIYDELTGVNVSMCYYRGYYEEAHSEIPYERTMTWWHVMAGRLTFVILFEHLVFFLQAVVQHLTPDVPEHVTLRIEREKFVAKKAMIRHERKRRQGNYKVAHTVMPVDELHED